MRKKGHFDARLLKNPGYRLDEPGIGLDDWKVLTYADLASDAEQPYHRAAMTVNITGNYGVVHVLLRLQEVL